MALMSYLIKDRHGTYYFRRVIPEDLRPFMPAPWADKANWKRSLATKIPADAKRAGSAALRECMVDFQLAELKRGRSIREELTEAELDAIAEYWRRTGLAGDDEFREIGYQDEEAFRRSVLADLIERGAPIAGARGPVTEVRAGPGGGMTLTQVENRMHDSEMMSAAARKALGMGDTSMVDFEVSDTLDVFGVKLPESSRSRRKLALKFLEALASQTEIAGRRLFGEVIKVPAPEIPRGDGTVKVAVAAVPGASGATLSEAYTAWKAGSPARGSRKPSDRTILEADNAVRRFTEFHGDLRLSGITKQKAREFRDALAKVPLHLPAAQQRLGLRELAAMTFPENSAQ